MEPNKTAKNKHIAKTNVNIFTKTAVNMKC